MKNLPLGMIEYYKMKFITNHDRKVREKMEPSEQRLTTAWTRSYASFFDACLLNRCIGEIFATKQKQQYMSFKSWKAYHAEDMSVLAVKHLGWRSHYFQTNRALKLTAH